MYVQSNSNPPSLKLLDAMILAFKDKPERVARLKATRAIVVERISIAAGELRHNVASDTTE